MATSTLGNIGNFAKGIIFGSSNQSQQGAVTQGVPYANGASQLANPANPSAGIVPVSNAATPNPGESADLSKGATGSSLDDFKDIFTVKVDDKGVPIQTVDPLSQPLLTMDPAKLSAAAQKMNFAGNVDPATMAKALAGDAASLTLLLNNAGQSAFLAATHATTSIVEEAFKKNNQRYDAALPDRIRSHELQNSKAVNPVLNHPAAKAMVDTMKSSIAAANPHLTAAEVQSKSEGYVLALQTDLNANDAATSKANVRSTEPDFSSFMD